jgi:hypothetical protein
MTAPSGCRCSVISGAVHHFTASADNKVTNSSDRKLNRKEMRDRRKDTIR